MSRYAAALLASVLILTTGCTNRAARSLGHIAPTERRDWSSSASDLITLTDPILVKNSVSLLPVYRVDAKGHRTNKSSVAYGVFLMADVTQIEKHHYLGHVVAVKPDAAQEKELQTMRTVIYHKLLNVVESNGKEYWRRLFGGMKYAEAIDEGATALIGAGIASTFISPVLGASLTAAGAMSDAFSEELYSGFNPDLYREVQEAMQNEIDLEKAKIRGKMRADSYDSYPASEVVQDMVKLARMYSIEYGMKALAKANEARKKEIPAAIKAKEKEGEALVGAG